MNDGHSWSGNERNNCFLNLGDGRFADASYVSGLDFLDDGRAAAEVDWDGDGDLDLWLRNRTGPQLRFMLNQAVDAPRFLAFRLTGTEANRDAIGALVELVSDDRTLRRTVVAGDGYLSQSTRWLHFGLGGREVPEQVVVRWPGGASETIRIPEIDAHYAIVQDTGVAKRVERPRPTLAAGRHAEGELPSLTPVLLKSPLPLPPTLEPAVEEAVGDRHASLVVLWAHWCKPCIDELDALVAEQSLVAEAGVDVVALNLDPPEDHPRAVALFDEHVASRLAPANRFTLRHADGAQQEVLHSVLAAVLRRHDEFLLPTSLLVDRVGHLQAIYLGPAGGERVIADLERFVDGDLNAAFRSVYGGRWYFRTPRPYSELVNDLKEKDLREDARYYLGLWKFGQLNQPRTK